jgi:hypothetical protein
VKLWAANFGPRSYELCAFIPIKFAQSSWLESRSSYLFPIAGYSGTPLAKKLGINNDFRAALWHVPEEVRIELRGPLAKMPNPESQKGLETQAPARGSFNAIRNFFPQWVQVAVENKIVFPGQLCMVGF